MAFHQNYRPQSFAAIRGQAAIRETLARAAAADKFAPAYLFAGPRGTGKTTTARLLARAANCENLGAGGEPCGACPACRAFADGKMVDFTEFDAASHTGVDDARELIERAALAPAQFRRKIYLIDEAHMLSKSAWNALLKTLEEPPRGVHFLFCTTELEKVLPTIRSRCQTFFFGRIPDGEISQKLAEIATAENREIDPAALDLVAREAAGGMRDAEVLLEKLLTENPGKLTADAAARSLGLAPEAAVREFLDGVRARDRAGLFAQIARLDARGQDLRIFVRAVLGALREELLTAADPGPALRATEILTEAAAGLRSALVPTLPLEIAAARLCFGSEGGSAPLPTARPTGAPASPRGGAAPSGETPAVAGQTAADAAENSQKNPEKSRRSERSEEPAGDFQKNPAAGSRVVGDFGGREISQKNPTPAAPAGDGRPADSAPPTGSLREKILAVAPARIRPALRGGEIRVAGDAVIFRTGSERMAGMVETAAPELSRAVAEAGIAAKFRVERGAPGEIFSPPARGGGPAVGDFVKKSPAPDPADRAPAPGDGDAPAGPDEKSAPGVAAKFAAEL